MGKWQFKDLDTALTSLGIMLIVLADKIQEWTSLPSNVVYAAIIFIFSIQIFVWFKNRK